MYNYVIVEENHEIAYVIFNRVSERNSINMEFLRELNDVLDREEKNEDCKIVVLSGKNGYFCTGMDFKEYTKDASGPGSFKEDSQAMFMDLLRRISLYPKVIVSIVEGEAVAGGVGIAAASDLVFASADSRFSLSEALWGLLPSMVMPYLVRRIGYQNAFRMTLTTLPVFAEEAKEIRLADELFNERREVISKYFPRLLRIDSKTVAELKRYMRNMWIIDENMKNGAVEKTTALASGDTVMNNIDRFVKYKIFPWEQ